MMDRETKIQIVEALSEYSQEMVATSGYNLNSPRRNMFGNAKEPCKTELILHLKDGARIVLDNRHKESTVRQKYCGDEITDIGYLIPEWFSKVDYLDVKFRVPGKNHRMRIPLESVAWVELYQELTKQ